jgi:hypothetical protein
MPRRFQISFLMALSIAGCHRAAAKTDVAESADPDDVPITAADVDMPEMYSDAVDHIRSYRDRIRDAVAAGTPSQAHRPLDELEFVLERMPNLARDAGIPKRKWESVVLAAEDISELFGEVHAAIDERRKPDYEKVASGIDDAIERLATLTP